MCTNALVPIGAAIAGIRRGTANAVPGGTNTVWKPVDESSESQRLEIILGKAELHEPRPDRRSGSSSASASVAQRHQAMEEVMDSDRAAERHDATERGWTPPAPGDDRIADGSEPG